MKLLLIAVCLFASALSLPVGCTNTAYPWGTQVSCTDGTTFAKVASGATYPLFPNSNNANGGFPVISGRGAGGVCATISDCGSCANINGCVWATGRCISDAGCNGDPYCAQTPAQCSQQLVSTNKYYNNPTFAVVNGVEVPFPTNTGVVWPQDMKPIPAPAQPQQPILTGIPLYSGSSLQPTVTTGIPLYSASSLQPTVTTGIPLYAAPKLEPTFNSPTPVSQSVIPLYGASSLQPTYTAPLSAGIPLYGFGANRYVPTPLPSAVQIAPTIPYATSLTQISRPAVTVSAPAPVFNQPSFTTTTFSVLPFQSSFSSFPSTFSASSFSSPVVSPFSSFSGYSSPFNYFG